MKRCSYVIRENRRQGKVEKWSLREEPNKLHIMSVMNDLHSMFKLDINMEISVNCLRDFAKFDFFDAQFQLFVVDLLGSLHSRPIVFYYHQK